MTQEQDESCRSAHEIGSWFKTVLLNGVNGGLLQGHTRVVSVKWHMKGSTSTRVCTCQIQARAADFKGFDLEVE